MVVVKIKCGLGNQMFQYALGRRLALDWRDELKVDLSWFSNIKKGDIPRVLEIDGFNVVLNKATEKEIGQVAPGFFSKIMEKIRGRLSRNYFYRFYPGLLKKRSGVYLDGYFQSYKYFDSIREALIRDFVLKNGYSEEGRGLKEEINQAGQSVAIHVRRGDFATIRKSYNGLCDLAYYKNALSLIKKTHADVKIFVFSDNIEWAKENLNFGGPMIFVSRPSLTSVEELLLMSLCKHQIIANSTFSWWSAWLNQNPQKIVVAPSVWLVAAKIKTDDFLPPDWIQI